MSITLHMADINPFISSIESPVLLTMTVAVQERFDSNPDMRPSSPVPLQWPIGLNKPSDLIEC